MARTVKSGKSESGSKFSQPITAGSSSLLPAVDTFELARTRGVVEGQLPLSAAPRLRAELRDVSGTIPFRFEGFNDLLGRPAARLRLRGSLPLTCDRCAR